MTDNDNADPTMKPDEAVKIRHARDESPDEPGHENAEGHALKVRGAKDKSPDEPGDAQPGLDEAGRIKF